MKKSYAIALLKVPFCAVKGALLLLCLWHIVNVNADEPFRKHRADLFYCLPVKHSNIVFVGNSITNMHNWQEAFDNPLIVNRGISGAVTTEVRHNIAAYIGGKPAKIFLMIGINDLLKGYNDPYFPVENIAKTIMEIRKVSPRSRIYIQSILPTKKPQVAPGTITDCNKMLKDLCEAGRLTYIDVYSRLEEVGMGDSCYTYDGLHLTSKSYAVWCKALEPYIGKSIYRSATEVKPFSNGLQGSIGMRASYFAEYPVKASDILFIGDELIHTGEWTELLGNENIKNRGTGWGYASGNLAEIQAEIQPIFHNIKGGAPKQIFLYAGTEDVNKGTVAQALEKYNALLATLCLNAPDSKVYLMGIIPNASATLNKEKYEVFNKALQHISAQSVSMEYIDTYALFLKDGAANARYIKDNMLLGLGYARLATALAPYIKGSKPLTEQQAARNYAKSMRKISNNK